MARDRDSLPPKSSSVSAAASRVRSDAHRGDTRPRRGLGALQHPDDQRQRQRQRLVRVLARQVSQIMLALCRTAGNSRLNRIECRHCRVLV